jgi:hypothetical protein
MKVFVVVAASALFLGGCDDGVETQSTGGLAAGDAIPAFSAPDVNATSLTFDTDVAGTDFAGQVAAFYFGHAT